MLFSCDTCPIHFCIVVTLQGYGMSKITVGFCRLASYFPTYVAWFLVGWEASEPGGYHESSLLFARRDRWPLVRRVSRIDVGQIFILFTLLVAASPLSLYEGFRRMSPSVTPALFAHKLKPGRDGGGSVSLFAPPPEGLETLSFSLILPPPPSKKRAGICSVGLVNVLATKVILESEII